jgi:CheY-like chemotaxis protein
MVARTEARSEPPPVLTRGRHPFGPRHRILSIAPGSRSLHDAASGIAGQCRRVLVVEDSLETLDVLANILEFEGYEVFTAVNGREALSRVRSAPPDAILLDLWLPLMNGYQFLEELRKLPAPVGQVPVIVITADFRARPEDLPIQALLRKPLDLERLLMTIRGL